MRWYEPVEPPPDLAHLLACSWTATPSGVHRLVPDGCIDLLWTSAGRLVLCGPEVEAWTFSLPAGTTAAGVRFRPGVAPQLFGFEASDLLNQRVDLGVIVGGAEADRLARGLAATADLHGARTHLESQVRALTRHSGIDMAFADRVIGCLVEPGETTVRAIADAVGLTVRQLHRRSLTSFGYGPKTLGRLVRLQRFLAILETGLDRSLTQTAADAGYSDHAHLARDCRSITGLAPTQFLREYFPTFPDMSDPFKTEIPLVVKI